MDEHLDSKQNGEEQTKPVQCDAGNTPQAMTPFVMPRTVATLRPAKIHHPRRMRVFDYARDTMRKDGFTLVEVTIALGIMVIGFLAVMLTFSQGLQWAGEVKYGHTLSNAVRSAASHCMVEYKDAAALEAAAALDPQGGVNYETTGYAMKVFPGRLVQLHAARSTKTLPEPNEYGGWYWDRGAEEQVCLPGGYSGVTPFGYQAVEALPLADEEKLIFEAGAEWSDDEVDTAIRTGDLYTLRVVAYRSAAERDLGVEEKAIGFYYIKAYFKQY